MGTRHGLQIIHTLFVLDAPAGSWGGLGGGFGPVPIPADCGCLFPHSWGPCSAANGRKVAGEPSELPTKVQSKASTIANVPIKAALPKTASLFSIGQYGAVIPSWDQSVIYAC